VDCPSERGRNYTPLREVVHCALPGASCGQQMISVDFQSAPIITGEATLPLRWLRQLPLYGLATRKSFRKGIPFSKLKLYNRASDKSELTEGNMITPKLETDRLILREIHSDDTEAIFSCWMQDENVSKYMWWKASDDINEAKGFVKFELGNLENDKWNRWIIVLKSTNEIIGTCLIFFNDEEGHWDISYNLGKKFWSNGYATEAMSAVMKYAVKVMKIKEISTTYAIENSASGYVLQKLGFEFIKEVPYECNGGDIVTMGRYCRYEAR